MKEIVEYTSNYNLPFRVTTRANLIDDSKLEILAKNGCDWLSLGIESGDDEILKLSNKRMKAYDDHIATQKAAKHGLNVKGFFIIGLPGESEESAKKTIEFAKYLKGEGLTAADFYYLTPFPGTPIWNDPKKYGIEIIDKDYTNYLQAGKTAHCVIKTKYLNNKRIEELVGQAKREFKNE